MADSPCTICGRGFNGRAFIAYVNFYDDRDLMQKRLRLCMNCIVDHFLPVVENADSRNERGLWIDSRESRQWDSGAQSEVTDPVQVAAQLSSQRNATTPTSSASAGTKTTSSAENAGSQSQSQAQPYSAQSNKTDSLGIPGKTSATTSTSTSSSASRHRSTSRLPVKSKSTGS